MGPLAGVKVIEFAHIMAGPVCGLMLADMGADVIPAADWLECLERAGVPAGPVLDIAGMRADPQALARGMVTEAPHTRVGPVETLGHPVHYSATPAEITRGAPLLGEHTREVLAEYGYCAAQVDEFLAEKVAVAENL